MRSFIPTLLFCIFLACTPEEQTIAQNIPSGVYVASTNSQRIMVQGKRIQFWIQLDDLKTNLHHKSFADHSVWPNGYIQPFPMREADSILGVGKYEWLWDGTNIIRHNTRKEKDLKFSLKVD